MEKIYYGLGRADLDDHNVIPDLLLCVYVRFLVSFVIEMGLGAYIKSVTDVRKIAENRTAFGDRTVGGCKRQVSRPSLNLLYSWQPSLLPRVIE